MADESKNQFRDLNKFEKDMEESMETLKEKLPGLTDDELAHLIAENVMTTRLFKQTYNMLCSEKIRRVGKAGVQEEPSTDTAEQIESDP